MSDIDLNKVRTIRYGADYGVIVFNDGTEQQVTLKEAYDTARAIRKMRGGSFRTGNSEYPILGIAIEVP